MNKEEKDEKMSGLIADLIGSMMTQQQTENDIIKTSLRLMANDLIAGKKPGGFDPDTIIIDYKVKAVEVIEKRKEAEATLKAYTDKQQTQFSDDMTSMRLGIRNPFNNL